MTFTCALIVAILLTIIILCVHAAVSILQFTLLLAPNPPLNVNASTINSTAVRVSWNSPDITNGIIRYYTVAYRLNDSSQTMELNSTDVTVVLTSLDPFSHYVFYVVAVTVASSDPSENDTALTAEAGNTYKATLNTMPLLIIITFIF